MSAESRSTQGPEKNIEDLFKGDDWKLSSREELLSTAIKTFEDRLMKAGWSEKEVYFYALKLAFEEFLIDAMKHGNKFDKNKTVSVTLSIKKDKVSVKICDQGEGFDPKEVLARDLQSDENFATGSGRGLQMVNEFKDLVTFTHNEKGNEVTIETTGKV